jgi:hypothetical protein
MKPIDHCTTLVVFLAAAVMTLASCSSHLRYVSIETCRPASITFPEDVKKVLIVNHVAPQPDVPFESTFRKLPDSIQITADSAIAGFCRILGQEIAQSPYFADVRLYEGAYPVNTLYAFDSELTTSEVRQLCDEHDVDAVISVDKLFFHIKESIQRLYGLDAGYETETGLSGVLRIRLPDQETPLQVVRLSDTIYTRSHPDEYFEYETGAPDPRSILSPVAEYVATQTRTYFIPYWSADTRWYYVSPSSRWKEASAYAAAEKWEKAAEIWANLYEKATKKAASPKTKARLASNLALCAELADDLTQALSWAGKAYQHLLSYSDEDSQIAKMQKSYIDVLKYRIQAEKKLQLQTRRINL